MKKSKLLLNKHGLISVVEEEAPPPPPKNDDRNEFSQTCLTFFLKKIFLGGLRQYLFIFMSQSVS